MPSTEETRRNSTITDATVEFIFSRDERRWLLLIVALGFILRFIVASHLAPVEDESGSITHAIGFSKLAPLSQMAQAQVWYYLTDYSFRIFGISLLTGRLLSVIFGTLSIILVYLIASLMFNKKTGLVAAFLLAISAYHITWTASYQDQTMMFFVLLASYFFIKEYKQSGKISIISAVFLAIAELVKIITGVFILVFGFFSLLILYKNYRGDKKLFRENFKRAVIFVVVLAVAMTPILAYNYFLYKQKGIVDLPFAQFLRINPEFYTGPGLHHGEGFVINKLPRNLYNVFTLYFIREDLLIFLLASLGVIYTLGKFRRMRFGEAFLLGMFFFALLFIASAIVLQTHYTSFLPLMSIFGASLVVRLSNINSLKKHSKHIILAIMILILLFNLWNIREPLTSKSALQKMREFSVSSIDKNSLVLVDSRIYTGTYAWIFNDRSYVDASRLPEILEASANYRGNKQEIKIVFIECVNDDCGWGTIRDQPELNASMENLISQFKNVSTKITEIDGGGSITGVRGAEILGEPFYRVYETSSLMPAEVLEAVKKTHNHFLYHIPRDAYPEQAFDYYTVNGFFDNTLNFFAYLILYTIVLAAFLSMGVPFYLLFKQR